MEYPADYINKVICGECDTCKFFRKTYKVIIFPENKKKNIENYCKFQRKPISELIDSIKWGCIEYREKGEKSEQQKQQGINYIAKCQEKAMRQCKIY